MRLKVFVAAAVIYVASGAVANDAAVAVISVATVTVVFSLRRCS